MGMAVQINTVCDDLIKAVKAVTRKSRYYDTEARIGITKTDFTAQNSQKHKQRKTCTNNKETTQGKKSTGKRHLRSRRWHMIQDVQIRHVQLFSHELFPLLSVKFVCELAASTVSALC